MKNIIILALLGMSANAIRVQQKGDAEGKPKPLFPLEPKAPQHKLTKAQEVKFSKAGYPDVEKVHTLSPELHMEWSNQDSTFKFPRTAFYAQTDAEINKEDKDIGMTHYDDWVAKVVRMNVSPVAQGCRAEPDGSMNKECNEHLAHHGGLAQVTPIQPTCTNANKATGLDQDCSAPGQSAWNTISTSRTGDPTKAQAAPYPDHALH